MGASSGFDSRCGGLKFGIMRNTFDRTVYSLCLEIDDLKEQVEFWKSKYETEIQERNIEWKERSEEAMRGVGNALLFALSVQDDENGNLVISKESRKELAQNWK